MLLTDGSGNLDDGGDVIVVKLTNGFKVPSCSPIPSAVLGARTPAVPSNTVRIEQRTCGAPQQQIDDEEHTVL